MNLRSVVIPLVAIILALIIGALIIKLLGMDPVLAYTNLAIGAFGNIYGISNTLTQATPLIFTGLSFALARRAGLLNIGAEGQLYIGGLCSVLTGAFIHGLPMIIHLPLALLAGFVGGGFWGWIAGWLKVKFGSNEIITTVMLNYIAIYLVSYMVSGPIIEPPGDLPQSPPVLPSAQLPYLGSGTQLHLGFVLALIMAGLYCIFMWHTRKGYEARVVGFNPDAGAYAGINRNQLIYLIMFLAGGLAGLGGSGEILGIQHRLYQNFSPGYGYDGIAVALLGLNTTIGTVLDANLIGALRSGGNLMQVVAKVPLDLVYVIEALVIIFVASEYLFRRVKLPKLNFRFRRGIERSEPL